MITATITSIEYASPDNSEVRLVWSNGATQTVPLDWMGFFRGGAGATLGGVEVQYIDGTEGSGGSVVDAFVRNGGTIQPYVAPPVPFKSLSRPAFLFMMSKIGVTEQAVEQLIAGMPEGTQAEQDAKALALIVFKNTTTFERTNQLLNTLTAAYGLTSDQVDTAWRAAEQIVW